MSLRFRMSLLLETCASHSCCFTWRVSATLAEAVNSRNRKPRSLANPQQPASPGAKISSQHACEASASLLAGPSVNYVVKSRTCCTVYRHTGNAADICVPTDTRFFGDSQIVGAPQWTIIECFDIKAKLAGDAPVLPGEQTNIRTSLKGL